MTEETYIPEGYKRLVDMRVTLFFGSTPVPQTEEEAEKFIRETVPDFDVEMVLEGFREGMQKLDYKNVGLAAMIALDSYSKVA